MAAETKCKAKFEAMFYTKSVTLQYLVSSKWPGPVQQKFYILCKKKSCQNPGGEKKTAYGHSLSTVSATLQPVMENAWLEELARSVICSNEFTFGKAILHTKRILKKLRTAGNMRNHKK